MGAVTFCKCNKEKPSDTEVIFSPEAKENGTVEEDPLSCRKFKCEVIKQDDESQVIDEENRNSISELGHSNNNLTIPNDMQAHQRNTSNDMNIEFNEDKISLKEIINNLDIQKEKEKEEEFFSAENGTVQVNEINGESMGYLKSAHTENEQSGLPSQSRVAAVSNEDVGACDLTTSTKKPKQLGSEAIIESSSLLLKENINDCLIPQQMGFTLINQNKQPDVNTIEDFPEKKISGSDPQFSKKADTSCQTNEKLSQAKMTKMRVFQNISSIIPEKKLLNCLDDDILYHGNLKKLMNYESKSHKDKLYSLRFCTMTKKEFKYFTTKEQFITLQKPLCTIPLYQISQVRLVKLASESKTYDHFYMSIGNSEENSYGPALTDKKNCYSRLINSFIPNPEHNESLLVFSAEREDLLNKWVVVLNYFITSK